MLDLLRELDTGGKYLAAICAGPLVLEQAGVLKGKKATCYPGMETGFKTALFSPEKVVADGRIITSRGPGTTMEFALKLVDIWAGSEIARQLRQSMVMD